MPVGGELLVFSFSDKLESFPDGWPCGREKDKEHKAELLKCYSCSRNCFSYIFISSVIIRLNYFLYVNFVTLMWLSPARIAYIIWPSCMKWATTTRCVCLLEIDTLLVFIAAPAVFCLSVPDN